MKISSVFLLMMTISILAVTLASPHTFAEDGKSRDIPAGATQDWFETIQQNIEKEEYHFSPASGEKDALYQAPNRAQGFRSYFSEKGVRLVPRSEGNPSWEWGLELVGKTEGGKLKAEVKTDGNRIEINRGNIVEWYVNDENGLEQGFTIYKRESAGAVHESPGALNIDMKLTGSLHPKFAEDGQAVDFYSPDCSIAVLRYSALKVTDATGRVLPSRFEGFTRSVSDSGNSTPIGGIRILVDDTNAAYPITVDPLATSPAWVITGQASVYLGRRVAVAGDVNSDGYSDMLVQDSYNVYLYLGSSSGLQTTSAGYEISGAGVAPAGDVNGDGYSDVLFFGVDYGVSNYAVRLYLGGPLGLTLSTTLTCPDASCSYAEFGISAAAAGDVNGDGYGDVIVGAQNFGAVGPGYTNGMGKIFLYLGSTAGLSSSPYWTATGETLRDFLGSSVATAGDVNGDGYADLLAGAKGWTDRPGKAYLYPGGPSGPGAAAAWTTVGEALDDNLGAAVASAGDTDGDGYSDVVVAAPGYGTDAGRVYFYRGGASGLEATPFRIFTGEAPGDDLGAVLTTAGDVDGDGYADVMVSAQGNASNTGKAYLYRGGPSGLAATSAWTAVGEAAGDEFGAALAGGGDANGDGHCDLLIAAPLFLPDPGAPTIHGGRAYLFTGGPSGPASAAGWSGSGEEIANYFGWSVDSAGDVNGDGYTDIVVGASGYNSQTGKAYLFQGSPSGLFATAAWTAVGEAGSGSFGISVAGAGDVNSDGYADVVVGARAFNSIAGKAYLYLGSPTGLSSAAAWSATGEGNSNYFGGSVASAGDVNGDGYSDVIIGAFGYGSSMGKAYLYFGMSGGLSSSATWTSTGEAAGDNYGASVGTAGDVNGDGYSDIVVGAYRFKLETGKAYVYLGSPSGLSSTSSWSQSGADIDYRFGSAVAAAGDVNGDSYSDVLIGATFYNSRAGRAYLYLGGAAGLADSAAWNAYGEASSVFGAALASAGDVNGDGFSDVVVGAPGSSSILGKTYLYLGSPAGLDMSEAWIASGAATADRFGYAVGAADVNGDGYSDLLIGAPYNTTGTGKAYSFGGNGGVCLPLVPRQLRADGTAPIAPLGIAFEQEARLGAILRNPFGRGLAKLEWQAVPLHGSLSPAINPVQSFSRWYDTNLSGTARAELVNLSETTGPWTWRVRVHYNPATTALMAHSRWLTIDANGHRETDLRSAITAPPQPCVIPDEPCWIYLVTTDGTNHTLNFQDPNQVDQRTGWNVRRSNDASVLPKSSWPLVGTNVVDMDAGAVNYQWTDSSGADPGPGGVWYYLITTYNNNCPAEGPFSNE